MQAIFQKKERFLKKEKRLSRESKLRIAEWFLYRSVSQNRFNVLKMRMKNRMKICGAPRFKGIANINMSHRAFRNGSAFILKFRENRHENFAEICSNPVAADIE